MTKIEYVINVEVEEGRELAPFLFVSCSMMSELMKRYSFDTPMSSGQFQQGYTSLTFRHAFGTIGLVTVNEPAEFYMFGEADTYHMYNLETAIWGDDNADSNV